MAVPGCLDKLTRRLSSKARASARGSPRRLRKRHGPQRTDRGQDEFPLAAESAAQARWRGTGCGRDTPQRHAAVTVLGQFAGRCAEDGGIESRVEGPPRRPPRRAMRRHVPGVVRQGAPGLVPSRRARGRPAPPEGGPAPASQRCPVPAAPCCPVPAARCRPALPTPLCAYRHHQPLPPFAGRPPLGPWPLLSGPAGTKPGQIRCEAPQLVRILACVTGDDFPAILAAAQDGSEDAFAALWRDANPALLR